MELDWTTFALEVLNFLILVWLLQRFLYRPVRAVIERRRASIAADIQRAETARSEAETLQQSYERRQADWARERVAAQAALDQELAAERERRLSELRGALEAERQKASVLAEREQQAARARVAGEARALGASFASRLLSRVAGPELTARLLDMAVEDLAALPAERPQALAAAGGAVAVLSAHPLPAQARALLEQALTPLLGKAATFSYDVDPELLAGLRVEVGSWRLAASLRDELAFFSEDRHG